MGDTTNHARGAAPASGLNFQATVTAIAATHLLDGSRIGWLGELVDDTPCAIWSESGGPGDDVRLDLGPAIAEVQVKRGLAANETLWDALLDLARGVCDGRIDFGVLVVSADSSRTVRHYLEQDLRHIGDGRRDRLHEVGTKWIAKLEAAGLDPTEASRRIRIQTVAATDGNVDALRAAKALLLRTCGTAAAADLAWQALVEAAHALIARKGRWDLLAIVRLLTAANVALGAGAMAAQLIARAISWARATNQTFTVFGAAQPIPLDAAWIPLNAHVIDPAETPADAAAAMASYRGFEGRSIGQDREETYEAEFLGRFKPRGVIVAGPGLGKSTLLRRMAQRYANDGYPVLKVQLRSVAASLAAGESFEAAIIRHGLDGSGLGAVASIAADGWILLADGLDECGSAQEEVAGGLDRFGIGHPACRIIVTTRPIGYETRLLAGWPHYALIRPDSSAATPHVGRLVSAIAPEASPLRSSGYAAAATAFRDSKPAHAIARDPQLLGMAAALIVRGEPLGRSRVELFQRLFASLERSATIKAADVVDDIDFCHAVLDQIGWEVTAEPLGAHDQLLKQVAAVLASQLATTPLAVAKRVRAAAAFWEKIGVIERIHHRHAPLLAFVHKSFGEYAAARALIALEPSMRTDALRRLAGFSQWSEVLNFAAGLGHGAEVIDALLSANDPVRAVEIAADPAVDLPEAAAESLAETAFLELDQREDRITIGAALAELSARHPAAVGPRAALRTAHPNQEMRRIAWACVVMAGPDYHDPNEAARQALEMLARAGPGVRPSLMGGIRLMRSDQLELTRRMAIANLGLLARRWTKTEIRAHAELLIGDESAATASFVQEVTEIIRPLGIELPARKQRAGSALDLMRADSEYGEAELKATIGLLDAIADGIGMSNDDVPAEPLDVAAHPLLQISGLIRIIGFWTTSGADAWAWTKPYERAPLAELLRIIIALSNLDAMRLAREVATIRRKLDEGPRATMFWALDDVRYVHIDDPQWERLGEVVPDLQLVERALAHGSEWVLQVATEILAHAGIGCDHIARLLATTSGLGFASAGYLALLLPDQEGVPLILDRLEGPSAPGMRHLFRMLGQAAIDWSARVASVTERYLLGSSHSTANAAADFLLAHVTDGADVGAEMIWRAYRHWQQHEPRRDGSGAIPDSPRDALLKALIAGDQVSNKALFEASADDRHDISKAAAETLLARAGQDPEVVRLIGGAIAEGAIGPHLTDQLLAADLPLDQDTIEAIVQRLEDDNPRWRLAASGILHVRYLPLARLRVAIETLAADKHSEIREAAARAARRIDEHVA